MLDPFAPGLLARLPEPPRRVVVVRASRIGDFLCATPALRALRAALPAAEFTVIGLPFNRDLAERSPHVDRFVPFPGFPGIAEQFFDARTATAFFRRMQGEAFDLAIQMHGSGVYANPFTLLLGARHTAGFVRPGDGPSRLDAALPLPDRGHEIDRVLALPRFLGAPDRGRQVEFSLTPADHAAAAVLLADSRPPWIALHPGARDAARRWPAARFAAAGSALRARCGGTLVVVGNAETQQAAVTIAREAGGPVIDLAGRTSLPVLGAVLARCALLLTGDSGPAHIAYALDTPSVTIFGDTDPARWGPPTSGPHAVLDSRGAIASATVEEVFAAACRVMCLTGEHRHSESD